MAEARHLRFQWLAHTITVALLFCPLAMGRTIRVANDATADHATIQAAIDASVHGDTVLVAPGTYTGDGNRDIDFKGKAITVRSEAGPRSCIVDAQGSMNARHRGFYFHSGEQADSVLDGFTITGGYQPYGEGGQFSVLGAVPPSGIVS
jgi:polygalacturonase